MYKILNQTDTQTEILLYSLIEGGLTASRLIRALKDSQSENITLRINSEGGEVFDSIAIYNYLKGRNVNVIIDGICASGASIVAMAGKSITMKQGSMLMIHNPLTFAAGDAEELRLQAEILDKITLSLAGIYSTRTGKPQEEILTLMAGELWMNETEALNAGFVDQIETDIPEPPETVDASAKSYDDGVKAERERLRALDELYAPGREVFLNMAKYVTLQNASEIAIDILKAEKHPESPAVNNHRTVSAAESEISAMADLINSKRGVRKHAR